LPLIGVYVSSLCDEVGGCVGPSSGLLPGCAVWPHDAGLTLNTALYFSFNSDEEVRWYRQYF